MYNGDGNVVCGEHWFLEHKRDFHVKLLKGQGRDLRATVPEEAGAMGMQDSGGGLIQEGNFSHNKREERISIDKNKCFRRVGVGAGS